MNVFGPFLLASVIMFGGGAYVTHVARNVTPFVPDPARAKVRDLAAKVPAAAKSARDKVSAARAQRTAASGGGKRRLERVVFAGPSPLPASNPAPPVQPPAAIPLAAVRTRPPARPSPVRLAEVTAMPVDLPGTVSGAGADLFNAVNVITANAKAGGIRSKVRALLMMAEGLEAMAMALTQLSRELAEPGMRYPAVVWEPVGQAGAHVKAAGLTCTEAHAALQAMLHRALGEQLGHVPHHDELNRE